MRLTASSLVALITLVSMGGTTAQEPPARVTIVYDAFGKPSALKRGWGYSALVEYGGKRVPFDTGGKPDRFTFNANPRRVELAALGFAGLTHRHGDHTRGL